MCGWCDLKHQLLLNTYTPSLAYEFRKDSPGLRCFRHAWLAKYAPWLAYSAIFKEALGKYCVPFPQTVHPGTQDAFIINTYTTYKNFNEDSCQFENAVNRKIQENRSKLAPTILLCATHDIALRGKASDTGNIQGLFQFRIEAGDENTTRSYGECSKQSTHQPGHEE